MRDHTQDDNDRFHSFVPTVCRVQRDDERSTQESVVRRTAESADSQNSQSCEVRLGSEQTKRAGRSEAGGFFRLFNGKFM